MKKPESKLKESSDAVFECMPELENIPSMEEMFRICDMRKQKRGYSTEEVIKLTHELREDKLDIKRVEP